MLVLCHAIELVPFLIECKIRKKNGGIKARQILYDLESSSVILKTHCCQVVQTGFTNPTFYCFTCVLLFVL